MKEKEESVYILVADFLIHIHFHSYVMEYSRFQLKLTILQLLSGFVVKYVPQKVDFEICITQRRGLEILSSQPNFLKYFDVAAGDRIITFYDVSIATFQMILTNTIDQLVTSHQGFNLHASSIRVGGHARLFIGREGAGKSTVITLLTRNYSVLGDDSAIVRKIKNSYYLYQTPSVEREYWIPRRKGRHKIDRVYILKKSRVPRIQKMEKLSEINRLLLHHVWVEKDTVNRAAENVLAFSVEFENIYTFYFDKERESTVELIRNDIV